MAHWDRNTGDHCPIPVCALFPKTADVLLLSHRDLRNSARARLIADVIDDWTRVRNCLCLSPLTLSFFVAAP